MTALDAAIAESIPAQPHQSFNAMMKFCRHLRGLESQGGPFGTEELKQAFEKWHEAAKPNLRHERELYFLEFMACYISTKPATGGCQ